MNQGHRPEQADGTGAEDYGVVAILGGLARLDRACPGLAGLDLPKLLDGFFGDGEGFNENGDIARIGRDEVHVLGVIDDKFGHIAVPAFDAAFREIARVTEILPTRPARDAFGMIARPPNHGDDEIAFFEVRDGRPDFDDFAERFVADDQVLGALRAVCRIGM